MVEMETNESVPLCVVETPSFFSPFFFCFWCVGPGSSYTVRGGREGGKDATPLSHHLRHDEKKPTSNVHRAERGPPESCTAYGWMESPSAMYPRKTATVSVSVDSLPATSPLVATTSEPDAPRRTRSRERVPLALGDQWMRLQARYIPGRGAVYDITPEVGRAARSDSSPSPRGWGK